MSEEPTNWVTLLLVSQKGFRLREAEGLHTSRKRPAGVNIRLQVYLKPMSAFSPLYQDALKFAPKFSRKGQ